MFNIQVANIRTCLKMIAAQSLLAPYERLPMVSMQSYSLVFVHTHGCQDANDFFQIGKYVKEISPTIEPFVVNNESKNLLTRKRAAKAPTLIFSPGILLEFSPLRGKLYAGGFIQKDMQLKRLMAGGIEVPLFVELLEHTWLDPNVFGEVALTKGTSIHASRSRGVLLQRLENIRWKAPDQYPPDHPGRYGPIIVQKFIDTGLYTSWYRVLTLFGEPLLAYKNTSTVPRCNLSSSDAILSTTVIRAARKTGQTKALIYDDDVLTLARRVYKVFPEIPLQACDIIREEGTGKLFVLEINPGGNTWAFSRERTPEVLKELGVDDLTFQFDAFRTAARVLAEKTRNEAE